MIAGLGLMVTCFILVIVLVFICSRKLRDTQFGGSLGLQSPKLLPPRYDEVVTIDSLNTEDAGLPTYWQASRGD